MNLQTVVKALVSRRQELTRELTRVGLALEALGPSRRKTGVGRGRRIVAKRRVMDAATRAKISKRMRRSWAEKRKAAKAKA